MTVLEKVETLVRRAAFLDLAIAERGDPRGWSIREFEALTWALELLEEYHPDELEKARERVAARPPRLTRQT